MKQAISLVLLGVFVSSLFGPAAAQKGRTAELKKQPPLTRKDPRSNPQLAMPTATRFGSVGAYTDGNGVYIAWQMEAEVGNIGFNIYRITKDGTEHLNPSKLVAGAAMHAREVPMFGASYDYFDPAGTGGEVYYVEAQAIDGTRVTTDQLSAYYVSDLRTVSGKSSEELTRTNLPAKEQQLSNELEPFRELATEVRQNQLASDPATHLNVISQPGVVRIGVRNEGLYRVTRAQLEAAGFNVNSDSANWQLYVEGMQEAMIIGNNADYIEFYGKGTDTREADTRQYYLLNGSTPGKRIGTRVARRNTSTVVTRGYAQTFRFEENTNYMDDVDNGDLENYFGRGFGSIQTTIDFNLTGVDFSSPTTVLNLSFQGYSPGVHSVEVVFNDVILAPVPGAAGEVSFSAQYQLPTSALREGANSVKFRAVGPSDFVFFDKMSISHNRKFLAQQNRLSFFTQNYRTAQLEGFSSPNVRVFDMTYAGSPILMTNLVFQQNGATFGTSMPAARGRVFYAVDDSAIRAPVSVTPNNPELVGVPTNAADLVIISHGNFMTQAAAWADYRRGPGQNFTVKVIEVSELFDEFNYGTSSAAAIQSFLQYAHQNWQNPPEYALLLGDASVDPRNYDNQGNWNMVPSRMVSAVFSEVASDESMADFDNDGLAEIAIGRIASRDSVGIDNVLAKTRKWETHTTPHMRGTIFAYDSNVGYDFDGMSVRIESQLPVEIPSTFVYRFEPNAQANLVAAMNSPKWMVNYAGHGTTGVWGAASFFSILTVDVLADNENNPSVYTMLTCLNGAYHYLFNEPLAEKLTRRSNRGAVAAWASTGLTLPNIQENMATRFYLKAGEGTIPRMGDLIRDAKTVITIQDGGADVRRSWTLLGDPMLKVR